MLKGGLGLGQQTVRPSTLTDLSGLARGHDGPLEVCEVTGR